VLAFDNLSALPPWLSDTLCRLASGGSFAVRRLYTDQDEVLFDAARPVILNGIEEDVTRPDLADRALFLTLPSISDARPVTMLGGLGGAWGHRAGGTSSPNRLAAIFRMLSPFNRSRGRVTRAIEDGVGDTMVEPRPWWST
jgi:hypothetical protein